MVIRELELSVSHSDLQGGVGGNGRGPGSDSITKGQ